MTAPAAPPDRADEAAVLAELARHSTPTVLNALKRLGVHPADLRTADRSAVRCMAPALGVRVGYAVTRRLATRRVGGPPDPVREQELAGRLHELITATPGPRILVAQNTGDWRGPVCIWGEVTAAVNTALGCTAGITNGPVRDLPEMERLGFLAFAAGTDVGGGFVDSLDVGEPVEVGGLRVATGDILHADRHGVLLVPRAALAELPRAIRAVLAVERRVREAVARPGFTAADVAAAWVPRDTDGMQ